MSDTREVMPILEDSVTLEGHTINRVSEGENPIHDEGGTNERNKDGLIAFSFKDSNKQLVMPTLNTEGAMKVTFDAGTPRHARGEELATNLAKDILAEVASIPLVVNEIYNQVNGRGSCTRLCLIQVCYVIDKGLAGESITILDDAIVGAGNFTAEVSAVREINPIGATTHHLVIYATPLEEKTSKVRCKVECNELE